MKNKIIITIISIIAVFGFLTLVYFMTNGTQEKIYQEANLINSDDHVKWSSKRKNLLVEYSDFQCPACKTFHNELKKIEKDKNITDNITFVFRNFPLSQHLNAPMAAYAAEASAKQNKYFEMSDLLFDTQEEWASLKDPKKYFTDLAKKLNLDMDKFNKDIDSQEAKKKVQNDLNIGNTLPIDATPTFFINGNKVNINTFDEFTKLLTETANKK